MNTTSTGPAEKNDQSGACHPTTRRSKLVFFAFAAIALFFLLTEHRAHLFGLLPYVLLLACPLMHLFHHHGHGHHGNHAEHGTNAQPGERK